MPARHQPARAALRRPAAPHGLPPATACPKHSPPPPPFHTANSLPALCHAWVSNYNQHRHRRWGEPKAATDSPWANGDARRLMRCARGTACRCRNANAPQRPGNRTLTTRCWWLGQTQPSPNERFKRCTLPRAAPQHMTNGLTGRLLTTYIDKRHQAASIQALYRLALARTAKLATGGIGIIAFLAHLTTRQNYSGARRRFGP